MSEKPISPLRQRMLDDMNMRRFVPDTQREYIRAVKKLASFLGRSPDTATPEELRAFQLHLTETGVQPPTINATVTALRFFFKVTLDRPETTRHVVFVYEPRKLPRVLSPEEVLRLLEAAPGPKHKAALSVAYGAGLRAMEVVALKVCDIDSKRMMLRVDQGKGRKDRHAMLSPQLLELLRDWWRITQPKLWMFPGRDRINPMTTRQLHRVCHMAAELGRAPHMVEPPPTVVLRPVGRAVAPPGEAALRRWHELAADIDPVVSVPQARQRVDLDRPVAAVVHFGPASRTPADGHRRDR